MTLKGSTKSEVSTPISLRTADVNLFFLLHGTAVFTVAVPVFISYRMGFIGDNQKKKDHWDPIVL